MSLDIAQGPKVPTQARMNILAKQYWSADTVYKNVCIQLNVKGEYKLNIIGLPSYEFLYAPQGTHAEASEYPDFIKITTTPRTPNKYVCLTYEIPSPNSSPVPVNSDSPGIVPSP